MTQTWWLSFCDSDRPEGEQFLGAAIVDVTEADVEAARPIGNALRARHGLPPIEGADAWMAAAIHQSHVTRCNPGGQVLALRIDRAPEYPTKGAGLPRARLLSIADMRALGIHPVTGDGEDA